MLDFELMSFLSSFFPLSFVPIMNMPRVVKSTGWKFGDVACAEEVAMLDVRMSDMKQEDGNASFLSPLPRSILSVKYGVEYLDI